MKYWFFAFYRVIQFNTKFMTHTTHIIWDYNMIPNMSIYKVMLNVKANLRYTIEKRLERILNFKKQKFYT